jgi:hypothetical protein
MTSEYMASAYVRCKFAVPFTKDDAKRFSLKKDDIRVWLLLTFDVNFCVSFTKAYAKRFSLKKGTSE